MTILTVVLVVIGTAVALWGGVRGRRGRGVGGWASMWYAMALVVAGLLILAQAAALIAEYRTGTSGWRAMVERGVVVAVAIVPGLALAYAALFGRRWRAALLVVATALIALGFWLQVTTSRPSCCSGGAPTPQTSASTASTAP